MSHSKELLHDSIAILSVLMLAAIVCAPMYAGTVQAASAPAGRVLDLFTQKGGVGPGVPGGTFALGEMIGLTANVTFNGFPVQSQLVSFQVLDPQNNSFLVHSEFTDDMGLATVDFVLILTANTGTWTAVATSQLADMIISDFLTFNVTYQVPPHGPQAIFKENTETPMMNETVFFDASSSIAGWNGTTLMPITEYLWNFGDGNNTTVTTPTITHAYTMPGMYYVTLTVYAPGASPDTNTSLAQKKTVAPQVVGGYAVSLTSPVDMKSLISYSTAGLILALVFSITGLLCLHFHRPIKSAIRTASSFARKGMQK